MGGFLNIWWQPLANACTVSSCLFRLCFDRRLINLFPKELSALHVSAGQGSTIHFFMPWAVNEFGYTSTLLIQLQKLDLTTSLDFRKLLECETMEASSLLFYLINVDFY